MPRTISERLFRLKQLRRSMAKDVASLDAEITALERELRAAGFKPRKEMARPNAARFEEIAQILGSAVKSVCTKLEVNQPATGRR